MGLTTDSTETQRIIGGYNEQLNINKLESLEEVDEFLDRNDLPNTEPCRHRNLNRPMTGTRLNQ